MLLGDVLGDFLSQEWEKRLSQSAFPTMTDDTSTMTAHLSQGHVVHHFTERIRLASSAAFRQFPGERGRPMKDMARATKGCGREADHAAPAALSPRVLIPMGCIRPPAGAIVPECAFPHLAPVRPSTSLRAGERVGSGDMSPVATE